MALFPAGQNQTGTWETVTMPTISGVSNYLTFEKNTTTKRAKVSGFISLTTLSTYDAISGLFANAKPKNHTPISVVSSATTICNAYVRSDNGNLIVQSSTSVGANDLFISGECDIN